MSIVHCAGQGKYQLSQPCGGKAGRSPPLPPRAGFTLVALACAVPVGSLPWSIGMLRWYPRCHLPSSQREELASLAESPANTGSLCSSLPHAAVGPLTELSP